MRQPTGGGGLGEAEAEGQCRLGGVVTGWPDRPVGPNQPRVSSSGGPVVSLDPACPAPGAPRGPETQRGSHGQEAGPIPGATVSDFTQTESLGPERGHTPRPVPLTSEADPVVTVFPEAHRTNLP